MPGLRSCAASRRANEEAALPALEARRSDLAPPESEPGKDLRSENGSGSGSDGGSPPPYGAPSSLKLARYTDVTEYEAFEILEPPLTGEELDKVGRRMISVYNAGRRLFGEYRAELEHLKWYSTVWGPQRELTRLLKYRVTKQRLHILARSAVRRRWEALGVWNPNWGVVHYNDQIAERSKRSIRDENDKPWEWEWASEPQPDRSHPIRCVASQNAPPDRSHPAWRAALLRKGLRRGEFAQPPPRPVPSRTSSDSEKESFITSRPWFQYSLSLIEESERRERLGNDDYLLDSLPPATSTSVQMVWKDAGVWRDEWEHCSRSSGVGWRWSDESPSPDLEDYVKFTRSQLSELELQEYDSIVPERPKTPPEQLWPDWNPLETEGYDIGESPPRYADSTASRKSVSRAASPAAAPAATPTRKPRASRVKKPEQSSEAGVRRSSRIAALEAKKQKEPATKQRKRETEKEMNGTAGGKTKSGTRQRTSRPKA